MRISHLKIQTIPDFEPHTSSVHITRKHPIVMSATVTTTVRGVGATQLNKYDTPIGVTVRSLYTVDDLLYNRSQTIPDVPLVAYPATARSRADYVHYTAKDLDRFADHGARKFASMGLVPQVCSHKMNCSILFSHIPEFRFQNRSDCSSGAIKFRLCRLHFRPVTARICRFITLK